MIFFAALSYFAEFSATWRKCSLLMMLVHCTMYKIGHEKSRDILCYTVRLRPERGQRRGNTVCLTSLY